MYNFSDVNWECPKLIEGNSVYYTFLVRNNEDKNAIYSLCWKISLNIKLWREINPNSHYINLYLFVEQGVRPEAFEKLENEEIKKIIDSCIQTNRQDRWLILMWSNFFHRTGEIDELQYISHTKLRWSVWKYCLDFIVYIKQVPLYNTQSIPVHIERKT